MKRNLFCGLFVLSIASVSAASADDEWPGERRGYSTSNKARLYECVVRNRDSARSPLLYVESSSRSTALRRALAQCRRESFRPNACRVVGCRHIHRYDEDPMGPGSGFGPGE